MRFRFLKCRRRSTIILFAFLNATLLLMLWRVYGGRYGGPISPLTASPPPAAPPSKAPNRHITKMITIVLRQFEMFENDVTATLQSITSLLPNIQIIIISDAPSFLEYTIPNATLKNVKFLDLDVDLLSTSRELNPLSYIKTKYVLFVPDSLRLSSRQVLQQMLSVAGSANVARSDGVARKLGVAVGFSKSHPLACQQLELSLREWALRYSRAPPEWDSTCDAVSGKHALLLPTELLRVLPRPFMQPFPEALYLQTLTKNYKVRILSELVLSEGRSLFRSPQSKQQLRLLQSERRAALYRAVGVRKVAREAGNTEWHGCTRDSERCFPWVVSVLRWSPPCCLAHLRRTLRHALAALQQAGARCWLEGATLLGAVRRGDILPWASSLEIGIHEADISRVQWLLRAADRGGAQDPQGFLWEKATQGDYYRVVFSRRNRLHVDLLPFRQRNGTMSRETWFREHQTDFPERFLHPMSSIQLAGRQMPCPNNVRDFLELKFGKGIIEQTKRPGSNLPYP